MLCCLLCAVQLSGSQTKVNNEFSLFRVHLLLFWMSCNVGVVLIVMYFGWLSQFGYAVALAVGATMAYRVLGKFGWNLVNL